MNDGWLASLSMILPFIQKDLNIDFSKIGILTSILSVSGVILAIPAAAISKKFGGFRVLLSAAILYSCSFFILGFSSGFVFLIGAFTLASIGFGIFHPISFALIVHISEPKEIGKKMGSFTAIGDIGRIGVAAGVTLLISLSNWRNAAFIYGLIPLVLIFAIIALTKKDTMWTASENAHEAAHGLHCNARYVFAIASSFIDAFASSTLFVFIPFLYIYRGASTALLGSLSGAFFIGNMLGKYFSGKISDKLGSNRVFIFSEIIMAMLLIGLTSTRSIIFIVIISVLLGAVTKGTVPVINTIIANSVNNKKLFDKAFGIGSFMSGIASVLAPLLFGIIIDRHGILTVFKLSACFSIMAIIPLLVSIINDKRKSRTT
jgi:MFS family permease